MKTTVVKSPLATRLNRFYKVNPVELDALEALAHSERRYSRGDSIVARHEEQRVFVLILEGWIARCRFGESGYRQIIHFLLPGDLATPDVFVIRTADHDLVALSDVTVRLLDPVKLSSLLAKSETLAPGLWWAAELEDAILREHIVRLGRRSADKRVPHLLLELHKRLLNVDQASQNNFLLPLTQEDIADALGLSSVHVSRTLSALRKRGLIATEGRLVTIPDVQRLAEASDFDTTYFHENSSYQEFYRGEPD